VGHSRNMCESCGKRRATEAVHLPCLGADFPAETFAVCVPCAEFSRGTFGLDTSLGTGGVSARW
jgi:hypothetical protein